MLALLLACTDPTPTTLTGADAHVTVELLNPTSCSACDPFDGIDTLEVAVTTSGVEVASRRYAYPGETPAIPDLDSFGVVRIELRGLAGTRVVSAGRTAELALSPEADAQATLTFLPVNVGLPLTRSMTAPRSRHAAARRRDGTVILFGGVDPGRTRAYDSVEVYDPDTGRFTAHAATLPQATADPVVHHDADGALLVTGGWDPDADTLGLQATFTYDDISDELAAAGSLSVPRDGHCISRFLDHQGIIFGGTTGAENADYFKLEGSTGTWAFSGVRMFDMDQDDISGCATLPDGRTWVQGRSSASSGTWDFNADTMDTDVAGNSFTRLPNAPGTEAAVVRALEDGTIWIAGGEEEASNDVTAHTWLYDAADNVVRTGPELDAPRFDARVDDWIEPGWLAIGCGWGDDARRAPQASVELLDPSTGATSEAVPLDRERDGCVVTTLRDGALLVTGGHESTDDGMDAALIVPWIDD